MPLSKEQRKILSTLLDKYERSATFRGANKHTQTFTLTPEKLFPKYTDGAEYDFFLSLNEDIRQLSDRGFLSFSERNGRILKLRLNADSAEEICRALSRVSRRDLIGELDSVLKQKQKELAPFLESDSPDDAVLALDAYFTESCRRLASGKLPEYFDEDIKDYDDLLTCLTCLPGLQKEVYIRDLSVKLYKDSKRLETLRPRANSLLYKYGSFPDKDTILEECGVIRTPSHVMLKGPAVIEFDAQTLDVGVLSGDIAFSDSTLADIRTIKLNGRRLITVENLTSFHRMQPGGDTVLLYLGGYHNRTKRTFLRLLYEDNPDTEYLHFGDIDAGGFYIYEHLRRKTGIPFRLYRMDSATLLQYAEYAKPLTENDIVRIRRLKESCEDGTITDPWSGEIIETLSVMLQKNCKLEQEAVYF